MAESDDVALGQDLLARATVPRSLVLPPPPDPPARYLIVRPAGGRAEVEAGLSALFPGEPFAIRLLDEQCLVLTFPGRSMPLVPVDETAAGALGRLIARRLDSLAAEPDLPRGGVPVLPERVPGLESVDDFPPGCWVGEESGLDNLWALDAIRVRDAWRLSQRAGRPAMGLGIVIAQPDTGVTPHPQLSGVARAGAFNTMGDGPADDATDPLDAGFGLNPGHGTATASVVVSPAQEASDAVVGSAPRASHMPIRALRSVWLHEEIPIADAVDVAVEKGAHVITMSLGGVALPFSPLRAAIRRAVARQVIVLAASGNCVKIVVYPARFAECLAVAGTDAADQKWPGSCVGAAVDISAPAQNVLRASIEPRPQGSVGQGQGTSFAVALTAGVAACWLAHHGRDHLIREATARGETLQGMFARLLKATARRPSAGWDPLEQGAGIVDAEKLLAASLDLGLGTESPALEGAPASPAEEMRAFLTELLGEDPQLGDDALVRDGAEIASALLARRLDPAAQPTGAAGLAARCGGPVAEQLGAPPALPAGRVVDTDARAAQAERVARLRRALAFGKAVHEGASVEAAASGQMTTLPAPEELSARLDRLLAHRDERTPAERADFEKAVGLVRRHGLAGLDKLADASAVVPGRELAAIEAVVKTDGSRPSLLLRGGAIDEQDPMIGGWGSKLTALRSQIKARASLCGRIQPTHGHAARYCGTGFLVDPAGPWILSNFHVLQQARQQYPVSTLRAGDRLRIIGGLEIDFAGESGSAATSRWSIEEAVFPANAGEGFGHVDAVLLRLGRALDGSDLPGQDATASLARIRFSDDTDLVTGVIPLLGVIGFPSRPSYTADVVDGIDWGWVSAQLFGGRFGVKRLAPGEFYRALGSQTPDAQTKYAFGYDVTTLRGSSGSVVVSLTAADNPAFGLHFAGFDNDSNFALSTRALTEGFAGCRVPLT